MNDVKKMELHYKHVNYIDKTSGIDNMLTIYEKERTQIVSLIENNSKLLVQTLWNPKLSPIPIDNECLCQLGLSDVINLDDKDRHHLLRKSHRCTSCTNISRLSDLGPNVVEKDFLIEYGTHLGKRMILSKFLHEGSHLNINLIPKDNLLKIDNNSTNKSHLISDKFTNNILITWYLMEKIQTTITKLYTAFICKDNGYYLYEYPEIKDVKHLFEAMKTLDKKTIVKNILIQLSLTFSRAELSGKHIKLRFSPDLFSHDNYTSPFTCKLSNFSSLSLDNLIISNHSFENKEPVKIFSLNDKNQITSNLYIVNDENSGVYTFYILLLHLMTFSTFREIMYSEYMSLWKGLWLGGEEGDERGGERENQNESNEMKENDEVIFALKSSKKHESVEHILKDKHLRIDVFKFILQSLAKK